MNAGQAVAVVAWGQIKRVDGHPRGEGGSDGGLPEPRPRLLHGRWLVDTSSAMSQQNVQVVRRWVEAWDRDDLTAWFEFLDSDVRWIPTPQRPEETSIRGHDQTCAFLHEWFAPWDSYTVHLDEIIDARDDVVVVVLRHVGRESRSGLEVDMSLPGVITLRRGKITEVRWFLEKRDALEAAGLDG